MTHNLDPQIFRVVGVEPPSKGLDLIYVTIILQNMLGEQKREKIVLADIVTAYEFYRTQKSMLIKQKNSQFLDK